MSIEQIKHYPLSGNAFQTFHKLLEPGCEIINISFNINEIPEYGKDFEPFFSNKFQVLNNVISDCIYWFETDNKEEAQRLNHELEFYRQTRDNTDRVIPAKNTYNNSESKVLYVGARQGGTRIRTPIATNIRGRMFQHLGLYKKGSTGAIQFIHWAKNGSINLKIIKLPEQSREYLYVIEKLMAVELKPRFGKH